MKNVAVIGGGASGIIAALTAAENPENRVILFERQARIGKKLLATGNGRCNLTNTDASLGNYHGENPDFVLPSFAGMSPSAVLDYFHSLGLLTVTQYGGRVYPLSDNANSVLDVLRFALASAKVDVRCSSEVKLVSHRGDRFFVTTDSSVDEADSVIIACGGKAGAKLGGSSLGYDLLKALGHHCTKIYPSLVPVTSSSEYPRSLKGVRAEANVRLCKGGTLLAESNGEIQFTEKGVSGPVIFDISRSAAIFGGELSINLLHDYSSEEIFNMLFQRQRNSPELETQYIFSGMLHSRLGLVLVKYCSLRPSGLIGELDDSQLRTLAKAAQDFRIDVKGTSDFDSAQVTAGGIRTDEFNPNTLESRFVPGLYACGEVLDIDGDCGGYNLQWAWASGRLAGRLLK